MTDDEDIDGLAAEYVLGSLDHSERKVVDERRKENAALNEAIAAWERRLGPLSERLPGIAPPADLFGKILTKLSLAQSGRAATITALRLQHRKGVLVAGMAALAACLLLALGWALYLRAAEPALLVAQLHRTNGQGTGDEAHLPAFAVAIHPDQRTLTIRPIAIRPASGKRYALWLRQQGQANPIFLGNVSPSNVTTLPWSATRPLRDYVNAGLAVSLEQESSSPAQVPTGPIAFAGTLVGTDASKH
jgi:anti-sigma-K factor RskA